MIWHPRSGERGKKDFFINSDTMNHAKVEFGLKVIIFTSLCASLSCTVKGWVHGLQFPMRRHYKVSRVYHVTILQFVCYHLQLVLQYQRKKLLNRPFVRSWRR